MRYALCVKAKRRAPADRLWWLLLGLSLGLLLLKFFWTLALSEASVAYDAGMYRYLFLRHAEGFPPFWYADLDPWAREHSPGLFFFTTIILRLGLPIDWLIGWLWNTFVIVLLCILAWATARRWGRWAGALVLSLALLSSPYYEGFLQMFWKNEAALLFFVLTLALIDRRSWWALLPAALTVVTQNQTALHFVLVIVSWWLLLLPSHWRLREWRLATFGGVLLSLVAIVVIFPVRESILTHIRTLALSPGGNAPGGGMSSPLLHLSAGLPLYALGVGGWIYSLRRSVLSLWHIAALWAALFVALRILFYRRFFLHLDFFLLPFAALALYALWLRWRSALLRSLVLLLLFIQGYYALQFVRERTPRVDDAELARIRALEDHVPRDVPIIGLESKYAVWLRGLLPRHRVGGPGVFHFPNFSYEDWQDFIFGSHDDRVRLLSRLPPTTLLYVSDFFRAFHGDAARVFLADPCFEPLPDLPLLRIACSPPESPSRY